MNTAVEPVVWEHIAKAVEGVDKLMKKIQKKNVVHGDDVVDDDEGEGEGEGVVRERW